MPVPPAGFVVLDFLWNIARLSLADVQMGFRLDAVPVVATDKEH